MRILVCDGLEKTGVDILAAAEGITVDERANIKADEIAEIISEYDGLIVRSKTQVTAELLERAWSGLRSTHWVTGAVPGGAAGSSAP